jgi:hypothetical protein
MGIYAIPFAVDIEKVKAVFGCKNRELLAQIKTAPLYGHYASEIEGFDEALEDIFFKNINPVKSKPKSSFWDFLKFINSSETREKDGSVYGYVLLVICDYFGKRLLEHSDGFYCGKDFSLASKMLKEKGLQINFEDIFERHDVFDIPKIIDFPSITCYAKNEIEHFNSVLDKIGIDENQAYFGSDDYDELQGLLYEIRESFRICKAENVEMVAFTH